jgi:NADPH2:quinone reductase
VDDVVACSLLLQGVTALYLASAPHRIRRDDQVLVLAAAGGVGQLLTQLAKSRGATVIGVMSSEEKRAIALANGADHCLLYSPTLADTVRALSDGGVDVAYDAVGTTLDQSLRAVRPRGCVVVYGMAGGDHALIDPRTLMETSKVLAGFELWDHFVGPGERQARVDELFSAWRTGLVRTPAVETFPLCQGSRAHARLESRLTSGKVVLLPSAG